jgi:hypothetical protein
MDEEWSISMKKVKLDDIFGDKKKSFWKKNAKISVFERKKIAN